MTQTFVILFGLSSESAELSVAFDSIQPFPVPWRDAMYGDLLGPTHEYGPTPFP